MKIINVGGALVACGIMMMGRNASAAPQTHDGLQFRGAAGFGYLSDSESASGESASVHGPAGAFEVFVGGTPVPGLAIGGFISAVAATSPTVSLTLDGQEYSASNSNSTLNFVTIGPYVDYYPDPTSGLHVLGALGFAELDVSDGDGNTSTNSATGFSLGAGVGYDWWVSDEWSLGVLARLTYGSMKLTIDGVSFSEHAVAPTVAFSFAYN